MSLAKVVVSPLASGKLNFRTRTSDPKNQLFEKRKLVIYTPMGEAYQVCIKGKQKNGMGSLGRYACVPSGGREDSDDELDSTLTFDFSCSGKIIIL